MYEYEYGYDAMPFSVAVVLLASHVTLGPGLLWLDPRWNGCRSNAFLTSRLKIDYPPTTIRLIIEGEEDLLELS